MLSQISFSVTWQICILNEIFNIYILIKNIVHKKKFHWKSFDRPFKAKWQHNTFFLMNTIKDRFYKWRIFKKSTTVNNCEFVFFFLSVFLFSKSFPWMKLPNYKWKMKMTNSHSSWVNPPPFPANNIFHLTSISMCFYLLNSKGSDPGEKGNYQQAVNNHKLLQMH